MTRKSITLLFLSTHNVKKGKNTNIEVKLPCQVTGFEKSNKRFLVFLVLKVNQRPRDKKPVL